jgi:hypothetical protein
MQGQVRVIDDCRTQLFAVDAKERGRAIARRHLGATHAVNFHFVDSAVPNGAGSWRVVFRGPESAAWDRVVAEFADVVGGRVLEGVGR